MIRTARSKGFTLLELVIALAVISIISGGVFFAFRPTQQRNLQNASLQLQADLRYAQRRAIIEGRRFGVAFDLTANNYRIVAENPRETIRTVYFQDGVRLRYVTGARLNFLPRGTASSGFRIRLSNGDYWQQLTATVSGGRIRIFEITEGET